MKFTSVISFSTVILSLGAVKGFAPPRPGYGLRSTSRSPLAVNAQTRTRLRATTLDAIQEVETKTQDLPFYANLEESPLLQKAVDMPLSNGKLQQLQEEPTALAVPEKKDNKFLEFAGLGTWITGISSFLLVNNYLGPWPAGLLQSIPVKYFGLTHALSGMLFGGGIILTTLIEWLATGSKNPSVLNFYFDKVPALDKLVVLPALTASIVSGVGLSVDHYDSLGQAPFHVVGAISTLLAFAIWWASTDLTTQGAAMEAIQEWTQGDAENTDVPQIVQLRKISNVVSCLFVAAIYGFMVLKPGYTPPILA